MAVPPLQVFRATIETWTQGFPAARGPPEGNAPACTVWRTFSSNAHASSYMIRNEGCQPCCMSNTAARLSAAKLGCQLRCSVSIRQKPSSCTSLLATCTTCGPPPPNNGKRRTPLRRCSTRAHQSQVRKHAAQHLRTFVATCADATVAWKSLQAQCSSPHIERQYSALLHVDRATVFGPMRS